MWQSTQATLAGTQKPAKHLITRNGCPYNVWQLSRGSENIAPGAAGDNGTWYSHLPRMALVLASLPFNSVWISLGSVLCSPIGCWGTWLWPTVAPRNPFPWLWSAVATFASVSRGPVASFTSIRGLSPCSTGSRSTSTNIWVAITMSWWGRVAPISGWRGVIPLPPSCFTCISLVMLWHVEVSVLPSHGSPWVSTIHRSRHWASPTVSISHSCQLLLKWR